ncbi:Olfactory receptor 5A1, partial [Eschrichtius robustus]|nr:Olfactory receptor 5A1 [Eschrichtius robustus]
MGNMSTTKAWNGLSVTMFILLGFADHPELQAPLFVTFRGTYLVTLAWKLALIFLIRGDTHLHTPIYIVAAALKICSAEGRRKAFNTCASHLMAVTLLFGMALFMYLRPSSSYLLGRDKVVSVFCSLVIPMLNLVIYSLRSKEIKDALWKVLEKKKVFS